MDGTANLRKEHPGQKPGQPGQGRVLLWAVLANESHLYPILFFALLRSVFSKQSVSLQLHFLQSADSVLNKRLCSLYKIENEKKPL